MINYLRLYPFGYFSVLVHFANQPDQSRLWPFLKKISFTLKLYFAPLLFTSEVLHLFFSARFSFLWNFFPSFNLHYKLLIHFRIHFLALSTYIFYYQSIVQTLNSRWNLQLNVDLRIFKTITCWTDAAKQCWPFVPKPLKFLFYSPL